MSVTEDASTPAVALTAGGSAATTLASASFSPPAGSVLTALCLVTYGSFPGSPPTLTVSDSASGTWTASPAAISNSAAYVVMATFTRPVVTAPGAITVTMSRGADSSAAMLMLAVRVCDGANTSSPQGASNTTTAAAATAEIAVTPQQDGSLLYVLGGVPNQPTFTALSGTTTIDAVKDTVDDNAFGTGRYGPVASLVSTTTGWTLNSTQHSAVAVLEILPAPGTPAATPQPVVAPSMAAIQAASW